MGANIDKIFKNFFLFYNFSFFLLQILIELLRFFYHFLRNTLLIKR